MNAKVYLRFCLPLLGLAFSHYRARKYLQHGMGQPRITFSRHMKRGTSEPRRICQRKRLRITSIPMARIKPDLCYLTILIVLFAWQSGYSQDYFLFTSFRGNGEDGLRLMLSTNGYHWQALKNDSSFLKPEIGAKLMRDPCVAIGPDGLFHMVWTSGWTTEKGKVIGYSESKDLKHWSQQRAIELMQNEPGTRNIWAPEIFYDANQKRWLIYWSSTIPGKFPQSDTSGDDRYNHRAYLAITKNFTQIRESRLLYDPGFNMIDGTIFQSGSQFYFFFKDERN